MSGQVFTWDVIRPAQAISRPNGYFFIPAFSVTGITWIGASEVVAQFNFSASKNFTLLELPTQPTSPNFCPVIRWREGDVIHRYKLWNGVGEVLNEELFVPGRTIIKKNFSIEIWNIETSTEASLEEALTVTTTIRQVPVTLQDVSDFEDCSGALVNYASLQNTVQTEEPFVLATWVAMGVRQVYLCDQSLTKDGSNVITSWKNLIDDTVVVLDTNTGLVVSSTTDFGVRNKAKIYFPLTDKLSAGTFNPVFTAGNYVFLAVKIANWTAGVIYDDGATVISTNGDYQLTVDYKSTTAVIDVPVANKDNILIIAVEHEASPNVTNVVTVYDIADPDTNLDTDTQTSANPSTSAMTKLELGGATTPLFYLGDLIIASGLMTAAHKNYIRQYLSNRHAPSATLPLAFSSDVQWLDN